MRAAAVPFPPSYSSPSYPSPSLSLLRQGSRNRREEGERGKSDTAVQAIAVPPADKSNAAATFNRGGGILELSALRRRRRRAAAPPRPRSVI